MSITFLMCSERSGSNLITKMINAHPEMCGPSTKHIINPVVRNAFRYGDLKENWEQLVVDINHLINVNFSFWETSFTYESLMSLAPNGDLSTLLERIFMEEAKAHHKSHVFVKENQLYEVMSFLLIHFPNAKYLYQVRDPRDMALSWKNSQIHKGNVVKAARQWKKDQVQFLKDFSFLQGKALLIKYEDLISQTEETLIKVCNFFNMPYHEEMNNFYQDKLTTLNANNNEAWSNLSVGVMKDNREKYKAELTSTEIKCIEKICYPEMKVLQYELTHNLNELEEFSLEGFEHTLEDKYDSSSNNAGVNQNKEAKKVFYEKIIK
ncbi:sulfotransferase [Pontibacillus salicampi]|uniref:Sulfotransferase n=1 Tax=Pontibacillus salicampi TaxID=1449801 RepID=A0ABV6LSN8_9BACI